VSGISGQVRSVTALVRREMRRRAAVEPGHWARQGRAPDGRNYLKGQGSRGRPDQRRARRCWLQLQSAPALARAAFARLGALVSLFGLGWRAASAYVAVREEPMIVNPLR